LKEQIKFRELLDRLDIRVDMLRKAEADFRAALALLSERVTAIELGKKTDRRGISRTN
jgi:hypothetical protein